MHRAFSFCRQSPIWVVMGIGLSFFCGCAGEGTSLDKSSDRAASTQPNQSFLVSLLVRQADLPPLVELEATCSSSMTLVQWMEHLRSEGKLEFVCRGVGETAFVESISGLGDARGNQGWWTFRINGELIKQGCGTVLLKRGDRVEWIFGGQVSFGD